MTSIFQFLKLIRWVNLLIISLSMFLFQFCIVRLYINAADLTPTLNWPYFSLLVLATVLIAAAGNVVNAYFDFEQDMEYKPEKTMIGKVMSLDTAFNLQLGLNVAGVLLGSFLAYHFEQPKLGYVFISCAALLWIYSQRLKQYFLIGNLIVALLSAFIFVLPILFEPQLFSFFQSELQTLATGIIVIQLKWYFLFAFLMSLVREIAKDAEDREADAAYCYRTLPVLISPFLTNLVICLLILAVMTSVGIVELYFWQHSLKRHFWYSIFFIQFQLLTNLLLSITASRQADYRNLGILLKVVMTFGVVSMPVYYCFIKLWR